MKFLTKYISKSIQEKILRRVISVDKLDDFKDITIKIAETFEEYKKSSELLHDCYVGKKLMESHPSKMRCNIHSFLPHNTVIIAVNKKGEVIGTVSLIQDGPLGIPADSVYAKELNEIRNSNHRELVEVSALAIGPEYRKHSHAVQFLLNKYLYIFCKDYLSINTLIIVVHPNAELFYSALLLFEPKGEIIHYDFVKGALAKLLFLDFSGSFEESIWNIYKRRKNSLCDYILFQKDERLIFKAIKEDEVSTRNREIMIMLINSSQFDLIKLNRIELSYMISGLNLRGEDLQLLGLQESEVIYDYRFSKKITALGKVNELDTFFKICNLSSHGAFLETSLPQVNLLSMGKITFKWRNTIFTSRFIVRWINDGVSNKLPVGIGIEFLDQEINFFNEEICYLKHAR